MRKNKRGSGSEVVWLCYGKGDNESIFIFRMSAERAMKMQKDLFLSFIDNEKAFDRVRHEDLIQMYCRWKIYYINFKLALKTKGSGEE